MVRKGANLKKNKFQVCYALIVALAGDNVIRITMQVLGVED